MLPIAGMKKKVLILVFSNLKTDARVMRQIESLKDEYDLTVVCLDINPTEDYQAIVLPRHKLTFFRKALSAVFLLSKAFFKAHSILYPYQAFLDRSFKDEHFDLIIANDVETLPLAFRFKGPQTRIMLDAHEYAPLHFENKFWWRVFFQDFNTFLCKKYIPLLDGMTTIGSGLAKAYEHNFGKKPVVITNATYYHDLSPKFSDSPVIRIVHHGIVNRSRKIELIIQMMDYLPENFTLDLVLVVPAFAYQAKAYFAELKENSRNKRVTFRDAVPIHQIIELLREYDMGVILAPPINFNYANGLPNKLFDYIQARLAVLTGPTPEIANIVRTYNLGVVADGFTPEEMARNVAILSREQINLLKERSDAAAKEYNAEKNRIILNDYIRSILA